MEEGTPTNNHKDDHIDGKAHCKIGEEQPNKPWKSL
jgi:hypothetical protein